LETSYSRARGVACSNVKDLRLTDVAVFLRPPVMRIKDSRKVTLQQVLCPRRLPVPARGRRREQRDSVMESDLSAAKKSVELASGVPPTPLRSTASWDNDERAQSADAACRSPSNVCGRHGAFMMARQPFKMAPVVIPQEYPMPHLDKRGSKSSLARKEGTDSARKTG